MSPDKRGANPRIREAPGSFGPSRAEYAVLMPARPAPRRVDIVLFPGFELLDVFGPVEALSMAEERVGIRLLGPVAGTVASSQGTEVVAAAAWADAETPDIVLVPGGAGTRDLVHDGAFLTWLRGWADEAAIVASVCTGSAVLAAAGLLDGYRATSNKLAYAWATGFGTEVDWQRRARWVVDRNRWTSSGVSAGTDMALALLDSIVEPGAGDRAARLIEHERNSDPDRDPFAA
ncbi:DJ-1/PfpI family protein [Leucobacter iarius]|uniref:DJ-1/PfpI family protein n=2 Tax=Leucobacter iarius TaxID=333963 RepID=A0ABP4Y3H6_9MICO